MKSMWAGLYIMFNLMECIQTYINDTGSSGEVFQYRDTYFKWNLNVNDLLRDISYKYVEFFPNDKKMKKFPRFVETFYDIPENDAQEYLNQLSREGNDALDFFRN